jgi:UDP-GlcNAc:undecaprenyl-phosphate GlcNAc-1-phosphate transferase
MDVLVLALLSAFAGSLILTPIVRAIARRWGALDRPDGERKLHRRIVPLWGGVAVYLATVLGLLIAHCGAFGAGDALTHLSLLVVAVGGLICAVGAIDDRYHLRARVKLVLQIAAVLPVVLLGYSIDRIVTFGYPIDLGWLGAPLTVLWLVGCINALNLLDGMDGLATTVGLSTAAMLGIIATSMGNLHVAAIAAVLAGALAGFLPYNLPQASIFLGDSGSMIIGFMVGILGFQGALKTSATLSIAAPAVVMALPLFDTVLAVFRRKLTGRRFDSPDRQHIHHRLLDRGLTPWQALCVIGALCLLSGGGATAATIFRNDALAWITALTLIVAMIRLRLFGHHELALAKSFVASRIVTWANRLGHFNPVYQLPPVEHLAELPLDELWAVFLQEVKPWKVSHLTLSLTSSDASRLTFEWHATPTTSEAETDWSLREVIEGGEGRRCELLTGGGQLPGMEFAGLTGLGQVLKVFGTCFSTHPSLLNVSLSKRSELSTTSGPGRSWSKAA